MRSDGEVEWYGRVCYAFAFFFCVLFLLVYLVKISKSPENIIIST
jgi:hypothetical protein